MRLSLSVPGNILDEVGNWPFMIDLARVFDAAGVDRVVAPDHIVFGESLETYGDPKTGGVAGGTQPTGSDGNYFEPMTLLAALCGVTKDIRLGTNVLLAALRRPVVLAKSAATIDVLSGGRLDLGVGVGWQSAEYEAAGLDFARRGRQLDHTLEVCQRLWTQTRASYDSPELMFENIHSMPKPVQPGGVPIWCGGRVNASVARRLASYATGWIPWDLQVADISTSIARLRERVVAAGGEDRSFPVQYGFYLDRAQDGQPDLDPFFRALPTLAESGITDVVLYRFRTTLNVDAAADEVGRLVDGFRSAVGRTPSG